LGVHAQAPFKGEIEIAAKLRDYNLEDYHPEKEGATLTSAEHRSNAITLLTTALGGCFRSRTEAADIRE
jgi:hypothetical protein